MKIYNLIPRYLIRELLNILARHKYDVIIKYGASGGYKNTYEGKNLVNKKAKLRNCHLGFGSYISGGCSFSGVKIGRFCSIGQNVTNLFASHPTKIWVSTHPAFYSLSRQAGFTFTRSQRYDEKAYLDRKNKIANIIGNDVWIGNDVKIMPGVIIEDGAIIAAGAVVTQNIDAFTIVGGVPAKIIRKRFSDSQISFLLNFQWWNRDLIWIKDNYEYFNDVEDFINHVSSDNRA